MTDRLDVLFLFGFLTFLHLWGGASIGAGLRATLAHPRIGGAGLRVLWGLLIGVTPLYFGFERGIRLDSWAAFTWQIACLLASASAVAFGLPRMRAWLLQPGMTAVMIGTLLMAAGAVIGALFFQGGSELLSLLLGGAGFIFGAMWFGSGISRLRGKA